MFDRFGKAKFAARVKALSSIGNCNVAKVIPSKKDKARRNERREKNWERTDW